VIKKCGRPRKQTRDTAVAQEKANHRRPNDEVKSSVQGALLKLNVEWGIPKVSPDYLPSRRMLITRHHSSVITITESYESAHLSDGDRKILALYLLDPQTQLKKHQASEKVILSVIQQ